MPRASPHRRALERGSRRPVANNYRGSALTHQLRNEVRSRGAMHFSDSSTSRALLALADRLGADSSKIRRELGIDDADLVRGAPPLELSQARPLWRAVAIETDRDDIGPLLAETMPIGSYGPLEFAAWAAPTFGESLELIARFTRVTPFMPDLEISIAGDDCAIAIVGPPDVPREMVEFTMSYLVLRLRQATGLATPFSSIELAHPAARNPSTHARIFGCPFVFGAARSAMRFSRQSWTHPMESGDRFTFSQLRKALDDMVARERGLVITVHHDGNWIQAGNAARIALHRRGALRRIMLALVTRHEREPGQPLARDELFAIGWPGDRALPRSASTRRSGSCASSACATPSAHATMAT